MAKDGKYLHITKNRIKSTFLYGDSAADYVSGINFRIPNVYEKI